MCQVGGGEKMDLDTAFDILRHEGKMRQRYYVRRDTRSKVSYEEEYWGEVIDPDGKKRSLIEEKEKKIEDCKEEIDFINSLPPGRILDVGCGFGYFLSAVSDDWEKHGVEISDYAAKVAKQYGKIFIGTLEDANYPDEFFHAVVMYHVIEHLENPEAIVQEVYRVLKKGGALVVGTPDFDSGCARRFRKNYRLLYPGESHISLFTTHSLRRLLQDFGFEVDRVEYPFFKTRYFTAENLARLFDTSQISPPFYGNIMTFYCHKTEEHGIVYEMLRRSATTIMNLAECHEQQVEKVIGLLINAISDNHKVLLCGNGGSAAQAQHLAGELVGRFKRERMPVPAIALTANPSIVTAIGNDYGFDQIFNRQVEALGNEGDVLIAFTTSGKSLNVLKALRAAKDQGMKTVAIVGRHTETVADEADVVVSVPSEDTSLIQDAHGAIIHVISGCLEGALFASHPLEK
jgi:D-sedoheptulose 7-phosphate isomerase